MSSEPPVKKARVVENDEFNASSVSRSSPDLISPIQQQSSDQLLINPLMIQACSPFCYLPPPIFALVCDHLSLDFKCCSLPVLSKMIKSMFIPSLCCRGHLVIWLDDEHKRGTNQPQWSNSWDRNYARLAYARHSSSIDCRIEKEDLLENEPHAHWYITRTLVSAVSGAHLRELKISDNALNDFSISIGFLESLSKLNSNQLRNLTYLHLELSVHDDEDNDEFIDLDWSSLWGGLRRCESLERLSVSVFDWHTILSAGAPEVFPDVVGPLLDNLPNSLIHLGLGLCHQYENLFIRKLADPSWLPHVQMIEDAIYRDHLMMLSGWSTIMTDSGRPRPIRSLEATMTYDLDFGSYNGLITLDITCPDVSMFSMLVSVSDHCLANLQSLHLDVVIRGHDLGKGAVFDISPVFYFASKRPLSTFELFLPPLADKQRVRTCGEAFLALSLMNKLTSLCLVARCMKPGEVLLVSVVQFPVACWPLLKDIHLEAIIGDIDTALSVITGSPSLSRLDVCSPVSWEPLLPNIRQLCPQFESLSSKS